MLLKVLAPKKQKSLAVGNSVSERDCPPQGSCLASSTRQLWAKCEWVMRYNHPLFTGDEFHDCSSSRAEATRLLLRDKVVKSGTWEGGQVSAFSTSLTVKTSAFSIVNNKRSPSNL